MTDDGRGGRLHPIMDALVPFLAGGFETYRTAILSEASTVGAVSGEALMALGALAERLSALAATYAEPERRAVATMWSKHHFARLIVPVLAADLLLGRRLPIGLADISVVADGAGRTQAFVVPPDVPARHDEDCRRFEDLVDGHLRPVIEALRANAGISPRVLWCNAGNLLETAVRTLAKAPGIDPLGLAAANDLLTRRTWPGGANPLFEPVRYTGDTPRRLRKVCCLRYLIPSLKLCGTCPLDREAA